MAEAALHVKNRVIHRQLDLQRGTVIIDDIVDDRLEQRLLRREIGPQGRLRPTDRARDRRHGGARITVRHKPLARRLDERLAPQRLGIVPRNLTDWYHFDCQPSSTPHEAHDTNNNRWPPSPLS